MKDLKKILTCFALGSILVAASCFIAAPLALSAGTVSIEAEKVGSDPAGLDDKVWSEAKEMNITLDGAGIFAEKKKQLSVRAVYTKGGKLSLLLSWEDPTKSMDGQEWVKEGDKWTQKEGSEDRVALNWEVRRIKNFATKGCAVVCHSEAKDPSEWKYHTDKAPQLGDLWVWESYRTQPLGHAGDYFVDDDSRKADKGTGKALRNINKFEDGPVYMQDPNKKPPIEGLLMDSQKLVIGENSITKTQAWMLEEFSGDFADITAKSSHENGKWTVMLQRNLETDSDTDVQINTRKKYSFGIAVFDNSGRQNSYNSPPLKLSF